MVLVVEAELIICFDVFYLSPENLYHRVYYIGAVAVENI